VWAVQRQYAKRYTIAETFVGAGGSHLGFKIMVFKLYILMNGVKIVLRL
jgi:hypothetical protein